MYMNAYEMRESGIYRSYDKGSYSPIRSIDYDKAQQQYNRWAALEKAEREAKRWK